MKVRKAEPGDIKEIVSIHTKILSEAFLSRLGKRFLMRHFYPIALDENRSICMVVEDKKKIVGFVVLAYNQSSFLKFLLKKTNRAVFALTVFFQGLVDPGLYFQTYNIIFHGKDQITDKNYQPLALANIPGIIAMGVDSLIQAKGIGSKLLEKTFESLQQKKADATVCRVEGRTEQAIHFYKKNGFHEIGFQSRGKTVYAILIRDLKIN